MPSGFSMSTIASFKSIENNHIVYRGKVYMKEFCWSLREHSMELIKFFKKMKLLTKQQQEPSENAKLCYICKDKFENNYGKDKKCCKVRDHCHCHYTGEYWSVTHSICDLKYGEPKVIPIVFPNGTNYDYHFTIKEPAKKFKGQFTCLGQNTEKYITFIVSIEKEVIKIDKIKKEVIKNISYRLKFFDSARFMASSLSNLFNNFGEEFIKSNVNTDTMIRHMKLAELDTKIASVFLNTQTLVII